MKILKYMTLTDIAKKILEVTQPALTRFAKANADEFPAPRKDGRYETKSVLEYLANRKENRKLKTKAQLILSQMSKESQNAEKPVVKKAKNTTLADGFPSASETEELTESAEMPSVLPVPVPKNGQQSSFGDILQQYRQAVQTTADTYERCVAEEDAVGAAAWLRLWGVAFDALGRAEERALDIGQRQGKLMPVDEVVAIVARAYGNVRSKLMSLPQKLAFEMAGTSNPAQAQKILDEEIREALNGLAENPFADNK